MVDGSANRLEAGLTKVRGQMSFVTSAMEAPWGLASQMPSLGLGNLAYEASPHLEGVKISLWGTITYYSLTQLEQPQFPASAAASNAYAPPPVGISRSARYDVHIFFADPECLRIAKTSTGRTLGTPYVKLRQDCSCELKNQFKGLKGENQTRSFHCGCGCYLLTRPSHGL
jgi:hypothetical protein